VSHKPAAGPSAALSTGQMEDLERALKQACGVCFSDKLRATLRTHFAGAARELGFEPTELIPKVLAGDPRSVAALVENAVIGETYFLRHPEHFAALRRLVFEPADRAAPLRIWSAGCASGEEAYSLAMTLLDCGRPPGMDRVLATDVSERSLEHARIGRYGSWSFRRELPELRARYFTGDPPRAEVVPAVRQLVQFRRHNLAKDPAPAGPFDVVLCRNVLIYFEAETSAQVLKKLLGAVRPGGYLIVGPVETALAAQLPVEWVEHGGAMLLRRPLAEPWARPLRAAPAPAARRHGPARANGAARPAARPSPREDGPRAGLPSPLPPSLFEVAREAARNGDVDAAERLATEAAAREQSPESYLLVSMASEARGDLKGAVEAVRRALYLDPELAVGHATLVPLYRRMGQHGEADRARRNALRALEGLHEGAVLRGVESITAGALRQALEQSAA